MNLTLLAPDIQESILCNFDASGSPQFLASLPGAQRRRVAVNRSHTSEQRV
jgi:hypothetical protein